MNNLVRHFSNDELDIKNITSITFEDKPIFFLKEIEEILGYENLSHSIINSDMLIENIDFVKIDGDKLLELKNLLSLSSSAAEPFNKFSPSLLVLTESGFNALVLSSRKPNAKKFRVWVTKDVLPSIHKTGSYSINNNAESLIPVEIATKTLKAHLEVSSLLEVPKHIGQIEAIKETRKECGVDFSSYLLNAPAQNHIEDKDIMLEPTEIVKRIDPPLSGIAINKRLKALGLQKKNGKDWEPTTIGKEYSSKHSWVKGNKSGYNLKWNLKKIKELIESDS